MTASQISSADAVASELHAAINEFTALSLTSITDDELLALLRQSETSRRQLEARDAELIAQLQQRNLPAKHSTRSPTTFLSQLLTLSPSEAGRRVRHADLLAPRITVTGEVLPPLLPATAAARAAGAITAAHVTVIEKAIDALPSSLPVADVEKAEALLVEDAQVFHAATLVGIAKQLKDTLDPDGTLTDVEQQRRRRHLSLSPLGDGMFRLAADLDGETAALAQTVLHSLAAPKPNPATGERDPRTGGQRLHDAFGAVMRMALRAGELPRSGGVPATVLITMTAEQYETRTGLAATSYGQKLTVDQALRLANEASISWLVHNSTGGVLNHGRTQRLATPNQTVALIARDQGCTFPGCDQPPEWTEKHHVVPWSQGGRTDLDNLVLLCDYHHDRIDNGGWHITIRDGVPWYTPPAWLDPEQRPRRNRRP